MKRHASGGAEGNRTPDLDNANVALYQLSYNPKFEHRFKNISKTTYRILSRINHLKNEFFKLSTQYYTTVKQSILKYMINYFGVTFLKISDITKMSYTKTAKYR